MTVQNSFRYREAWLHAAAEALRPLFEAAGYPIPLNIRLTCGFPSRRGAATKRRAIGQSWAPEASGDGHWEIMVSPVIDDPVEACGVLAHELIHASVGLACGHKRPFSTVARSIGLEGCMSATRVGDAFKRALMPILESVGPYPHAELQVGTGTGPKKQTTRLIKCECPDPACHYTVRVARGWLDDAGAPHCPRHGEMVEVAGAQRGHRQ